MNREEKHMQRSVHQRGWRVVAFTLIFFVLINALLPYRGEWGGVCATSITASNQDGYAYAVVVRYGVPVPFLSISQEGCFERRMKQVDWYALGFLIDLTAFLALGAALNGLFLLNNKKKK